MLLTSKSNAYYVHMYDICKTKQYLELQGFLEACFGEESASPNSATSPTASLPQVCQVQYFIGSLHHKFKLFPVGTEPQSVKLQKPFDWRY